MSLNDKLEAYFRKHAGEWLTMEQLAAEVGIGGWRTRVSNLHKSGFPIEKRPRWIVRDGKQVKVYDRRYVPAAAPVATAGHDTTWGLR